MAKHSIKTKVKNNEPWWPLFANNKTVIKYWHNRGMYMYGFQSPGDSERLAIGLKNIRERIAEKGWEE